jgi:hypothetical protein
MQNDFLPSTKAIGAQLLGNNPIPGKSYVGGGDGKLYPSDHLGVLIRSVGYVYFPWCSDDEE